MRTLLVLSFILLSSPAVLFAGPKVEVVIDDKAPQLEQRAADEVAALLKRLYQAEVTKLAAPSGSQPTIFIGSPTTNPALTFAKADWPKLTEQGHLVRSTKHRDQPALLIGGGSPVATYWAACEYAHHLGVRTMLYGDLDPITPPDFSLAGIDVKRDTSLPIRSWEMDYHTPVSFAAWTKAEQTAFVRQLAKLKFNRLVLRVRAGDPFIPFSAAGIDRKEGKFWDRDAFPVDGDTAGRSAFGGAKFFDNPEFAKTQSEAERMAVAKELLRAVITEAKALGMQSVFYIEPYDLPKDFDRNRVAEDAGLAKACAQATVRTYLENYPEIDAVMIGVHNARTHDFFADPTIWQRPDKSSVLVLEYSSGTEPHPFPGAREVILGGSTSAQALLDVEGIFHKPRTPAVASRDMLFSSWSLKPLPQVAHTAIVDVAEQLKKHHWDGYLVQLKSGSGCLDLSAYLLSRNSFGSKTSTAEACEQLLTPICGDEVHTRVTRAFEMVEGANRELETAGSRFMELDPREVWSNQYKSAEPAPRRWNGAREAYLNAMNEMYRANTRAREGSRSYTLYLARQFEFGFEYMNCLQALSNAGIAKKANDKEKQIAELEKALDSINNACNALAAVARSNSDRGLIAVLNAQLYRPLVKELEKVSE